MTSKPRFHRPLLVSYARYRWDPLRRQHQIVYPEGILVLNDPGAAIVQLCDGRTLDELVGALQQEFSAGDPASDVEEFLGRLEGKGLLRDVADT